MKKILLLVVAWVACSYSAFSQDVYFTEQNPQSNNTYLTASIVCSEAVTVVFEVITGLQHANRDGRSTYRVNYTSYMSEYLPAGSASTRKKMTVKLPQGKSPVELTADNTGAVLIISTVNGQPIDRAPLTLYNYR